MLSRSDLYLETLHVVAPRKRHSAVWVYLICTADVLVHPDNNENNISCARPSQNLQTSEIRGSNKNAKIPSL